MPVTVAQGHDPNFDEKLFAKYMGELRDPDGNKIKKELLNFLATGNPRQRLVPFTVNDRNRFLIPVKPNLYPESTEYRNKFQQILRVSIEGNWVYDPPNGDTSGDLFPAWRWMPPAMSFYVNAATIPDEGDDNTEIHIIPKLRDFEWLRGYDFIILSGFSGWEDDEEYSASLLLKRLELVNYDKTLLDAKSRAMLRRREANLRNSEGKWKKYIPADDLLYMNHDSPKGRFLLENEAEDEISIGTRGIGKSFTTIGMGPMYDFTFNGARSISDYMDKTTTRSTIIAAWGEKRVLDFAKKFTTMYDKQRTGVGSYVGDGESWGGPFWQQYEGSVKGTAILSKFIRARGGSGRVGVDNNIYIGNLASDPSLSAGKRADMYADEVGLSNNFSLVKGETKATSVRKTKAFKSLYTGTGGDFEKVQQVAQSFKNPVESKIRAYIDRFSRRPGKPTGRFYSSVFKSDLYRDDQGFTNTMEAYVSELQQRVSMLNSTDSLIQHIASQPFEYKEIFSGGSKGKYDTASINSRLEELNELTRKKKTYFLKPSVSKKAMMSGAVTPPPRLVTPPPGTPKPISGEPGDVSVNTDHSKLPGIMHRYPDSQEGSVRSAMKNWPPERVVFYDPVRYAEGGPSDAYVFTWQYANLKDPTDRYQGPLYERLFRLDDVDEIHEEAFMQAALYNAPIFYENNVRDFYRYAKRTDRLNQLIPSIPLITGEQNKRVLTEKDYGLYLAPAQAKYHERDLNTYLSKKIDETDPGSRTIYTCSESEVMLNHLLYDEDGVNNDVASGLKLVAQLERVIYGDLSDMAMNNSRNNNISDERLRKLKQANERHSRILAGRGGAHYRNTDTNRRTASRRR